MQEFQFGDDLFKDGEIIQLDEFVTCPSKKFGITIQRLVLKDGRRFPFFILNKASTFMDIGISNISLDGMKRLVREHRHRTFQISIKESTFSIFKPTVHIKVV